MLCTAASQSFQLAVIAIEHSTHTVIHAGAHVECFACTLTLAGITSIAAAQDLLLARGDWHSSEPVHGVMIGRAAYLNPWTWRHVDTAIFGSSADPGLTRRQLVHTYAEHCSQRMADTWQADVADELAGVADVFADHGETVVRVTSSHNSGCSSKNKKRKCLAGGALDLLTKRKYCYCTC
jgi:tRNA-dihydrouridine synthase